MEASSAAQTLPVESVTALVCPAAIRMVEKLPTGLASDGGDASAGAALSTIGAPASAPACVALAWAVTHDRTHWIVASSSAIVVGMRKPKGGVAVSFS